MTGCSYKVQFNVETKNASCIRCAWSAPELLGIARADGRVCEHVPHRDRAARATRRQQPGGLLAEGGRETGAHLEVLRGHQAGLVVCNVPQLDLP